LPAEVPIRLNVRTFDGDVRKQVLDAIKRIVEAEAEASNAPRSPEITPIDRYPLTVNDPATRRVAGAYGDYFGPRSRRGALRVGPRLRQG